MFEGNKLQEKTSSRHIYPTNLPRKDFFTMFQLEASIFYDA